MLSARLLLLSVLPPEGDGGGLYFGEVCLRLAACIPGWDGTRRDNSRLYDQINRHIQALKEKGAVISIFDESGNANRYWRAAFLG